MATKRKTTERLSVKYDRNTQALTFVVVDTEGKPIAGMPTLVSHPFADYPQAIVEDSTVHGVKQKIGDAAAIGKDEHGRSASWATKFAAMRAVHDNLTAGDWSQRGEGDGTNVGGLLFTAIQRVYPALTVDAIRAKLAKMDKATQAKMRKAPKIAAMIEEIKAEREKDAPAVSDDDVDGMFGELDAEDGEDDDAADDTDQP